MENEKRNDSFEYNNYNNDEATSNQCVACEEFAALPELRNNNDKNEKSVNSTLYERRLDIYNRLMQCIDECVATFGGRQELVTDDIAIINDLCDILEESFQYGLRQHQPKFVVSAALVFQNMQDIFTGASSLNSLVSCDVSFWDFCKRFLTSHEKDHYEDLSNVWTKRGLGRAFIRTALNEHSLYRYILMWLAERNDLNSFYTHWSLLMDDKISSGLVNIIKSLDSVLFALSVNKVELNVFPKNTTSCKSVVTNCKREPLIYAPEPLHDNFKTKKIAKVVERPIISLKCAPKHVSEKLQDQKSSSMSDVTKLNELTQAVQQGLLAPLNNESFTNIENCITNLSNLQENAKELNENSISSTSSVKDGESDSSSQFCKSPKSSAQCNKAKEFHGCNLEKHRQLEQQLNEANELCSTLNTRVAKLKLENHQLTRRLKKFFLESGIDPSSSFATNFLITIPEALLSTSGSYYLYDIHITMRQNLEHWSVRRRYNDFSKLHRTLLKTHPSVLRVEFPPKKRFRNKNILFVEERRQQLQIYLLNLVETLPQLEACKTKAELQKVFPFLRDS